MNDELSFFLRRFVDSSEVGGRMSALRVGFSEGRAGRRFFGLWFTEFLPCSVESGGARGTALAVRKASEKAMRAGDIFGL